MKIKLPKDDMIDVEEPVVKESRVRKTRKMKKFNMSGGVRKDPKSDAPRAIQRRRKQRRAENSRFTGSTIALAARYLGFVAMYIVVSTLGDSMGISALVIAFMAVMILIFEVFLLDIIQYLIKNIVISGNRFEFLGGLLGLIGTQLKVFLIGIILLPILTAIMSDMSITSIPLIVIVYWLYGIWGALEMVRWIVSNTILVR